MLSVIKPQHASATKAFTDLLTHIFHRFQGMLDFDYVCERKRPSVAAMVYPFRYMYCIS